MSELQDMLRVQARLPRKQGANALGQLFESAIEEIQLLKKTYNQLFDAFQDCQGELAKANELADELLARVGEAEARLASAAITGKGSYPSDALKKFALKKKFEALSDLLTDHEIMFDSENVGVHSQKIKSQIERLDEAIKNG